MKYLSILFLVVLFGCTKAKTVTVIKDCTGTYLRFEGKDYQVCNLEMVSSFAEGTTVKAIFKRINECNGSARDAFVCKMLHPNEGWIEIEKIKPN